MKWLKRIFEYTPLENEAKCPLCKKNMYKEYFEPANALICENKECVRYGLFMSHHAVVK